MGIDLKLREGRSCKVTEGVKFKCDHKKKKLKNIPAPGGSRTPDLRITSAANTAYKYDALTDWATGAGCAECLDELVLYEPSKW